MSSQKRKPARIFICHSSFDKVFAELVASGLKDQSLIPWLDKEQVFAGDDVLEKIGEGLRAMDFLIFIVSQDALRSPWIERELKFAVRQEIEQRRVLILPFIIDSTPSSELPWYLHPVLAVRVNSDHQGVRTILNSVRQMASRRMAPAERRWAKRRKVKRDAVVDAVISGVGLGEWKAATAAALEVIKYTDDLGVNPVFHALLGYRDLSDEDKLLWSSLHTIEMCADLSPDLISRSILVQLATHPNFSVRSSAASICLNWAQFDPGRIPVDILLKLSVHSEDWYVERPANAALKSMVRAVPAVLQIYYSRLRSSDAREREHSASNLCEIAEKEPDLLDRRDFAGAILELERMGDRDALEYLRRALALIGEGEPSSKYKYGL